MLHGRARRAAMPPQGVRLIIRPPVSTAPPPAASSVPAPNPKPVPLFELATQWQAIRNDVEAAVKEVFDTQQYTSGATSGPFVGRFEESLGKRVGAHVIALSSGTDAILAALMALGI